MPRCSAYRQEFPEEELNDGKWGNQMTGDYSSSKRMKKNEFLETFGDLIIEWMRKNEKLLVDSYDRYPQEAMKERDKIEKMISLSRQNHEGGLNLETLDEITIWGFGRKFPLRDLNRAKRITREAFKFIENGDYYQGIRELLMITGVGISSASKIVGLSNQEKLCIYDSRVGHALRELKLGTRKIILCPPDRGYKRDCDSTTKNGWAANYEKLVWTLEVIRDNLELKELPRIADIEMALYIVGK